MSPSIGVASPFSDTDKEQLQARGIPEARALEQLEIFRRGHRPVILEKPATTEDGIHILAADEKQKLRFLYEQAASEGRCMEFVPASGAASRMFQSLLVILQRKDKPSYALLVEEAKTNKHAGEFLIWFKGLEDFPFYNELRNESQKNGLSFEKCVTEKNYRPILETLFSNEGLDYASLPKALIPFHTSKGVAHTPLHEHLLDASELVKDKNGIVRVHFTVSAEHESRIHLLIERVRSKFLDQGCHLEITLSQQPKATDTLSVGSDQAPVRDNDNTLHFRPGGHGALLENLNHLQGDIVFIKNIDNVVPQRLRALVTENRKWLGGYLLHLQQRIFEYSVWLDSNPEVDSQSPRLKDILTFIETSLGIRWPKNPKSAVANSPVSQAQIRIMKEILHRPLRVCGMVKNQSEPGGGPFWVQYADGSVRLQIVESAQIDKSSKHQSALANAATHFNPVDIVCGLRDRNGKPFSLQQFVDRETYFITTKSNDGIEVKVLELPGLWNGSMAFWNTAFVEIPVEVFNPVKTVNDLLRPSHRG